MTARRDNNFVVRRYGQCSGRYAVCNGRSGENESSDWKLVGTCLAQGLKVSSVGKANEALNVAVCYEPVS